MSDTGNSAKIIEIPTGQLAEQNGAFVAIFCRSIQPYLNYDRPIKGSKDEAFAYVLMQLRWDGVFGFPGGKVDPGETLRQAAVREVLEEIGYVIKEEDLIPVCSHKQEGKNFAAHLFAVEVNAEALQAAVRSSWGAGDLGSEVCGVVTPRIGVDGIENGKGLARFINSTPMSFSAHNELILLIERQKLLNEVSLKLLKSKLTS